MQCPYCGAKATDVIDSRTSNEIALVRRRRECTACRKRFTTYERPEIELYVIKKDGRREKFDKQKLMAGITKACEKRPIPHEKISGIVDSVEQELLKKDKIEIPSKVIGELVMRKLRKLDKIAYIRFASVYRQFADVHDFKSLLKLLK